MPCRDWQDFPSKMELERQNFYVLLCSACRALQRLGYVFAENPGLDQWWSQHEEADLLRRQEEAKQRLKREEAVRISQKPFKDLTYDDKQLLREVGLL